MIEDPQRSLIYRRVYLLKQVLCLTNVITDAGSGAQHGMRDRLLQAMTSLLEQTSSGVRSPNANEFDIPIDVVVHKMLDYMGGMNESAVKQRFSETYLKLLKYFTEDVSTTTGSCYEPIDLILRLAHRLSRRCWRSRRTMS